MEASAGAVIRLIHLGFIAWMVYAPFSGVDEFLVMHAVVVPFLVLHWLTSTDGCFLTLLEKRVRRLNEDRESFIYNIVSPLYVIDDASLRWVVLGATLGLWAVTLRQLSWATVQKTLLGKPKFTG